MLPEILPEVRIKITRGPAGDSVIILENIPKDLLYTTTRKQIPKLDRDGEFTGETKPGKEIVEVLKEKLQMSQSGDGFIQFEIRNPDVQMIYKSVMNYVEKSLPRGELIPKPVPYSSMPGNPMANPIRIDQIPRVTLPVSSPPIAKTIEIGTPSVLVKPKQKRVLSEEARERLRENAKKAREAKKVK